MSSSAVETQVYSRTQRRDLSVPLVVLLLSIPALIPLFVVVGAVFTPEQAIWGHLASYVLPHLIGNTAKLVLSSGSQEPRHDGSTQGDSYART